MDYRQPWWGISWCWISKEREIEVVHVGLSKTVEARLRLCLGRDGCVVRGLETLALCANALAQRKLPHRVRKKSGEYRPGADAIQVMTMKVSKGLEFPVVALPGVGHMPAAGEDEKEAARVFYVAATRATHRLLITVSGNSGFRQRLEM